MWGWVLRHVSPRPIVLDALRGNSRISHSLTRSLNGLSVISAAPCSRFLTFTSLSAALVSEEQLYIAVDYVTCKAQCEASWSFVLGYFSLVVSNTFYPVLVSVMSSVIASRSDLFKYDIDLMTKNKLKVVVAY